MLQTVETRWFGQGDVPADIWTWFEALPGNSEDQRPRRDLYLQPIQDDRVNVKLREGGLEVKQRQAIYGRISFSHSVAGQVERWIKWRFSLDDSSSSVATMYANHSSWVSVHKERRLKHYQLDEAGVIDTAPPPTDVAGRRPEAGLMICHLELAVVRVGRNLWWTIAYETDVQGDNTLDGLVSIAGRQFEVRAPGQLIETNSFGYPHWLATYVD